MAGAVQVEDESQPVPYLGIMSGTSLDGVDLALCLFDVWEDDRHHPYKVLKKATLPYSDAWLERLTAAPNLSGRDLTLLDFDYGRLLGELAADFLHEFRSYYIYSPVVIASHGHTVFHEPDKGMTLQIGHGSAIAAASGRQVIHDFRSTDVCLGGQGAPLVPLADRDLFPDFEVCLNLGGFANVSVKTGDSLIAYDIAPFNYVLNLLAGRLGLPYDPEGSIAKSGRLLPNLIARMEALAYWAAPAPKSLGREFVEEHIIPLLADGGQVADQLHTYIEFAAGQIARALPPGSRALVTGGGAHNRYFISRLQEIASNQRIDVHVPDRDTIDYKEAIAFAYLGHCIHWGKPTALAQVTGARYDSLSARISPKP